MKSLIVPVLIILFVICSCNSTEQKKNEQVSGKIRLNQLGYLNGSVKRAVVVNTEAEEFTVSDSLGNTVFTGILSDRGVWDKSGEKVKIADFTLLEIPGKYTLQVKGEVSSWPFEIGKAIFNDVFGASLKAYYIQRASMAIEDKYAEIYNRPLAHPDTLCFYHQSSGKNIGSMKSAKGWYDAGDYNKYIVNAGYTVSMLLSFYESFPALVSDNTNIPESGNAISDLLDEVKYELDWAETMQDKDGGVFFKLTSKTFSAFVKPHEDTLPRFVVGKSTTSALNFAAMFGQAARIWRAADKDLSAKYLEAAEKAWTWAVNNPSAVYKNPSDISTGEYGHSEFSGDFFWAASQLYATTGKPEYKKFIEEKKVPFDFVSGENWRSYIKNLGYYAIVLPASKADEELKEEFRNSIASEADTQISILESSPYRQPLNSFVWGSNSDILDLAVIFAQAYMLSGEKKYFDAAVETADYIFGKNATGFSFVTGFGSKTPMNPHFRLSATDNIPDPIPGWVVGGPNANLNDEYSENRTYGVVYPEKEPAKCYVDLTASYASNEVAINWNAPLVYISGFLVNCSESVKK
jgi:endoglucanase